ncbi:MAG: rod shape-determining protein, partial [Clostridia bacterium]|nr:rod shape-determining protein [Clostridia bacterium]
MPSFDVGIDVGIDLGTSAVKIYTPDRGIVLNEPSVVAVDRDTDEIIAIGSEAYRMLGRTSDRVAAVYPLHDGVISNYNLAEAMLTTFVKMVCGNKMFMPRVVVCVPIGITEVEKRAVVDALRAAGARKVCLIDEAVAAALGAELDIAQPYGSMVCDIGAGTTDIGVMSLNGLCVSESIKVAGNAFDAAIVKQIKQVHNLLIGPRTAENIKKEIGCVYPRDRLLTGIVKGRDATTGMPKQINVTSDELLEAMEEPGILICRAVQNVLENTPPELVGDLFERG